MGYSAFTPMRSAKARDKMLSFMREHYRPWHVIQPTEDMSDESLHVVVVTEEWDWTAYLQEGESLSYNPGKLKIGFDFGHSGDPLGHYAFSILRWMALHGGKRRKISKKDVADLGETVPALVYDYSPAWPVLVRSKWEDRCPAEARWCLTDENGFKPMRRPWMPPGVELGDTVAIGVGLGPITDEQRAAIRAFIIGRWDVAGEEVDKTLAEPVPAFYAPHTHIKYLQDLLDDQGVLYEVETAPFVLDAYRQLMAEFEGPAFDACDKVIESELARLSALWGSL